MRTISRSKLQVDFYHLVASPLERILPQICEKVLAGGGRLLVVAGQPLLGQVDTQLWSYARDAFLPHGTAAQAGADRQPVLLSEAVEPLNAARNVALVDGMWRDEALGFDRAFHFFDETRIVEARDAWKHLIGHDGVERRYWKQDESGRWKQAA